MAVQWPLAVVRNQQEGKMKSRAEDLVPLSKRISAAELHLKIAFLFRQSSSDDERLSPFSWLVTHKKMLLNLFVYEYQNIRGEEIRSTSLTRRGSGTRSLMIVERWRQVRPPIVVAMRQTSSSYRDHYRLLVVLLGPQVKQHTIYPSRYLW